MREKYPYSLVALVVTLTACASVSSYSTADTDAPVISFIDHLVKVFPAETGIAVSFTGHFARVPPDLETELHRYLPQVRFHIADMLYVHWGADPVKLLIASDRSSGRILSYLWSLWFVQPTTSLNTIFLTRSWTDEAEFRDACVAFARLVAVGMDGRIGRIELEPAEPGKFLSLSRVSIELFNRQGKLWRVMKVHFQDVSGTIAPSSIIFEQTELSGGSPFTNLRMAPNYCIWTPPSSVLRADTAVLRWRAG